MHATIALRLKVPFDVDIDAPPVPMMEGRLVTNKQEVEDGHAKIEKQRVAASKKAEKELLTEIKKHPPHPAAELLDAVIEVIE